MITDPVQTVKDLIELAKAFYEDFEGTAKAIGEALGKDFTQLTQCGAFDKGKVIGSYVSPAFMLKLASKLAKFSKLTKGKLAKALEETKKDLGCASFAAGTVIITPNGSLSIETLTRGQQVLSRHEQNYLDKPQAVNNTFARTADHYYVLETEFDELKVTAEHPFWLQGQGWTEAKDIKAEDILASTAGDVLVYTNVRVDESIQVFNLSVDNTPSYFVGSGLWVHNSRCSDKRYVSDYPTRSPMHGKLGEWQGSRSDSVFKIDKEKNPELHELTGGEVRFEKGFPVFEDFAYEKGGKKAIVEVKGLNSIGISINSHVMAVY